MRVSTENQHGAAHYHGRVEIAEGAAVLQNGPAAETSRASTAGRGSNPRPLTHSPLPGVHVQPVEVSGQAALVGAERLVAAVRVDGPGGVVEHAAVAVAALDQGPVGGRHAPLVAVCDRPQKKGFGDPRDPMTP